MAYYNPKIYGTLGRTWQNIVIYFLLIPIYYVFFRLKVFGRENIPRDKTFVVMPNHLSNNDPPLISAALNINIAYMAKKELFPIPFWGAVVKSLAAFSVDREKVEKTTIKAAKEILTVKGWPVGIFLEGTRSKIPGVLGKPNLGAPFIANLAGVDVLPVGIVGSNKLFGPITVRIGKVFTVEKDLEKAKWQCAEKLSELTGFTVPKILEAPDETPEVKKASASRV